MEIKHANESNFDELVNNNLVLVDFFATWCGPCKMLGPVLEDLASDRADVQIVKVDVDEATDLARKYGVMSVPTLILFKDGKEVDKTIGYLPKELLTSWIEKNK